MPLSRNSNLKARGEKTTISLHRAISLLNVLAERGEIGLSDLARSAELPKATVHRLLSTLSKAQLSSFEPVSERYRLGPRVLSWADKMVNSDELRLRSRTRLEQLSVETQESVGLVERLQNDSVCIMAVHSFHELRVAVRVGVPRPLYVGAPGKVLMAYLPEHEIRQALQKSSQKVSSPAALVKQLQSIKTRGFGSSSGESVPGLYSLAVPILDQWGRPRASLALYAPDSRVSAAREKQWLALLRKAATELQAVLVHSGHSVSSSSPVAA